MLSAFQAISLRIPKGFDVDWIDGSISVLQAGKWRWARRRGEAASSWHLWKPHIGPQPSAPLSRGQAPRYSCTLDIIRQGGFTAPRSIRSRIEWVWLHWSEYLLARDEFSRWFQKMTVVLEVPVELQVGLKEKQWQLSHAQVLLHNVDNQAVLLDRLLEEAASLFNRIGDPSVDEDAQKRMKAEYSAVKAKAQVRAVRWALASPLHPVSASVYPCSGVLTP